VAAHVLLPFDDEIPTNQLRERLLVVAMASSMYARLGPVVLGGGGGGIAYPAPSGETIVDMDMLEGKAWDQVGGWDVDPAVLGGVHKSTFRVTRETVATRTLSGTPTPGARPQPS
jgi:hypothetical protein